MASKPRSQGLPAIQPSSSRQAPESAFSRFVVAPVVFVTFLFSLALIDRRAAERIFGKEQHSKQHGYYHSHQKKLGKQEMADAFQIQRRVIVLFCLLSGLTVWVAVFAANRLWHLVFRRG
ncbi:hypothetical protein DV735_g868, partial [Chaetothyriales sp. CBS 134920]